MPAPLSGSSALLSASFRRAFRTALLRWFDRHQRDLPWRANHEPYCVWVSEIMLQQTRVAAVLEHYQYFLAQFPHLQSLAQATESRVLAAWSGLGYYRRARMMHAAARQLVREHKGVFPQDRQGWQELPGIGRYTAAAIASICFGERCAVVDGNVQRVLQRVLCHRSGDFWAWAGKLLSPKRPGDFNQAFMELGAVVCTPRNPKCHECPVRRLCQTASTAALISPRPLRARKKLTLDYCLREERGLVLLVPRGQHETVMPGMWELPQLPAPATEPPAGTRFMLRHAIMNTDYTVSVIRQEAGGPLPIVAPAGGKWFLPRQLAVLPLTGLARKALRRARIL